MVHRSPDTSYSGIDQVKAKCDETRPTCQNCQKRGLKCSGYKQPLKWSTKHETSHAVIAPAECELSIDANHAHDQSAQLRLITETRSTARVRRQSQTTETRITANSNHLHTPLTSEGRLYNNIEGNTGQNPVDCWGISHMTGEGSRDASTVEDISSNCLPSPPNLTPSKRTPKACDNCR